LVYLDSSVVMKSFQLVKKGHETKLYLYFSIFLFLVCNSGTQLPDVENVLNVNSCIKLQHNVYRCMWESDGHLALCVRL